MASLLPRQARADRHRRVTEINLGQVIHSVAHFRLDQAVSDHRIKQFAAHGNALPFEHAQIEFEIVPNLFDALGLPLDDAGAGENAA